MALPSSGALSLTDIQTEFGGSSPTSLFEYYRSPNGLTTANNTSVPLSGAISISDFYNTTRQFSFTISSDVVNANLRTLALAAGWDASSPVVATINSGVYVYSNSTGTPALTVNGSFPSGVSLINSGYIVGMGGAGGGGSSYGTSGASGSAGGNALTASVALSVTNSNVIAGGGGGGGGGQGGVSFEDSFPYTVGGGGGGGGQTSKTNSAGGSGAGTGNVGNIGTLSGAGSGGAGQTNYIAASGGGGSGGSWGASGASGSVAPSVQSSGPGPYSGGAGGTSVIGNSNITWIATGTRLGAVA